MLPAFPGWEVQILDSAKTGKSTLRFTDGDNRYLSGGLEEEARLVVAWSSEGYAPQNVASQERSTTKLTKHTKTPADLTGPGFAGPRSVRGSDRQDLRPRVFFLDDQSETKPEVLNRLVGSLPLTDRFAARGGPSGQRWLQIARTLVGFPFVPFVFFVVHALGTRHFNFGRIAFASATVLDWIDAAVLPVGTSI
jgi:hypothetical protein